MQTDENNRQDIAGGIIAFALMLISGGLLGIAITGLIEGWM